MAGLAKPVVKDNKISALGFPDDTWRIGARFYEGSAGEVMGNKFMASHIELEQATEVVGPSRPTLLDNE